MGLYTSIIVFKISSFFSFFSVFRIIQQAEATWKLRQEELVKDAKWKQFSQEKCKNYSADINKFEVSHRQ